MIRSLLQPKSATVLLIVLGFSVVCLAAQADATPPKELVQYVHGAREKGESEARIQQQAAALGWPKTVVDEAIAYDKSGKPIPESPAPVAVAAASPTGPSASFEVPRTDPVAAAAGVPDKPVAPTTRDVTTRGGPDDYRIGSGDTLQISVWEQADLSVRIF